MKKLLFILISTAITNINAQKDLNYVSGSWGLDYLDDYAYVNDFNVEFSDKESTDDIYNIDKNVSAYGEVKGNINLFRHVLPEEKTLDVTKYSFLNFEINNNEPIEIVIMQDDNREWKHRLRYTIPVNASKKAYTISFSDFKDNQGNIIEITNIKTIVFSVIGDYKNYKAFNFSVNELSFSKQRLLNTDHFSTIENTKLINYPNPFIGSTTIKLPVDSEFIKIKVFDLLGRTVDFRKLSTDNSKKKTQYDATNLKTGIYKYLLKTDDNKSHSGTFIVN